MDQRTVYVETSIISYLTARPSSDLIAAAWQKATNDAALVLSKALLAQSAVPQNALDDALHIAVSAVHGVDYLLTWNYRHIDNAETKPLIRRVCAAEGHACPEICTPQELMGVSEHG